MQGNRLIHFMYENVDSGFLNKVYRNILRFFLSMYIGILDLLRVGQY